MTQPQGSPTAPTSARMRVGVVQSTPAAQADYVWVLVDTALVQAAYFTGYVPIAGDRVVVTQDGTDWFVLGGKSGYAGNLVVNPDFDIGDPDIVTVEPPANWYHYRASGSGTSLVFADQANIHESPALGMSITSAAASSNYATGAAIPTEAGRTYRLDAVGDILSLGGSLTIELLATWFADGQLAYPSTVAADSLADSAISAATGMFGLGLNLVTAPAGARYMRPALHVIHNAGGTGYTVDFFHVSVYRQ